MISKNKSRYRPRFRTFFETKLGKYSPTLFNLYLQNQWKKYLQEDVSKVYFSKTPSQLGTVMVGKGSYSANAVNVHHVNRDTLIKIGNYTSIGLNLKIISSGGHCPDRLTTYPFLGDVIFKKGDVNIGSDVWIGDDVTIMGGVNIGNGAVIGTGSIVTKSVEPYSISAGIPARHLRYRLSKEIIEMLEKMAWWELPDETVRKISRHLVNGSGPEDLERIQCFLKEASYLTDTLPENQVIS